MDRTFDELAGPLAPVVTPTELIDALYVGRAPRCRARAVPVVRPFRWLARPLPELRVLPLVVDYARDLATLDRIGELADSDAALVTRGAACRVG